MVIFAFMSARDQSREISGAMLGKAAEGRQFFLGGTDGERRDAGTGTGRIGEKGCAVDAVILEERRLIARIPVADRVCPREPGHGDCITGSISLLTHSDYQSIHDKAMKRSKTNDVGLALALGLCLVSPLAAQQLVYQEGFNTDGEAATPKRYTTTGRDVYTVDRIKTEVDPATQQLGPAYWAHNFEVPNSFVGVPAPTPARRAQLAWDATITADAVSPQMQSVLTATFNWLLNNKANAKVVVLPNMAAAQYFSDLLGSAGHTVSDFVAGDSVTNYDLAVYAPGGDSSQVASAKVPVLTFSATDHDDLLVSTIGATATFEAGPVTVVTASHPAAGGQTGSFTGVTGSFTWQLLGDILPSGAITIASFTQTNPPTVRDLA